MFKRLLYLFYITILSLLSFVLVAQEMEATELVRLKELAEQNKKEGEEFLTENKKKEGVITLPSGLQYKVVKEGDGPIPTINDIVTVNYIGTLIDGTEFDSSYKRGQPATFPVKGVIPGFSQALQLMKVGSKWQLFIPSNLAYGERGAGKEIGPNATLIFYVELLKLPISKEGQTAPAFGQSSKEAIRALKKLEAKCQAGINYRDYVRALGEAKFEVNLFLEGKEAKNNPDLAELVTKAMKEYEEARDYWEMHIRSSWINISEVLNLKWEMASSYLKAAMTFISE